MGRGLRYPAHRYYAIGGALRIQHAKLIKIIGFAAKLLNIFVFFPPQYSLEEESDEEPDVRVEAPDGCQDGPEAFFSFGIAENTYA